MQATLGTSQSKKSHSERRASQNELISPKEAVYSYLLIHQNSSRDEIFEGLAIGHSDLNAALRELTDASLIQAYTTFEGMDNDGRDRLRAAGRTTELRYHAVINLKVVPDRSFVDCTNNSVLKRLARMVFESRVSG